MLMKMARQGHTMMKIVQGDGEVQDDDEDDEDGGCEMERWMIMKTIQ